MNIRVKKILALYNNIIIKTSNLPVIILNIPATSSNNIAFKIFYYTVLLLLFTKDKNIAKGYYADTGYIITIVDYNSIPKDLKVKKLFTKISIRGLENKRYYCDEYIIYTFYLFKLKIITIISREVYLVDNFKTNIFINVDILILEKIKFND